MLLEKEIRQKRALEPHSSSNFQLSIIAAGYTPWICINFGIAETTIWYFTKKYSAHPKHRQFGDWKNSIFVSHLLVIHSLIPNWYECIGMACVCAPKWNKIHESSQVSNARDRDNSAHQLQKRKYKFVGRFWYLLGAHVPVSPNPFVDFGVHLHTYPVIHIHTNTDKCAGVHKKWKICTFPYINGAENWVSV